MIQGVFGPGGYAYIIANIKVPRLMVDGTFALVIDTGATGTALHLRDAVQLLSATVVTNPAGIDQRSWAKIRKRFRLLGNPTAIDGVGGSATYFKEPAQITFTHQNGTEEDCDFELDIAKPARFGCKRFREQAELPSLLGINILNHFRLVVDYLNNKIFLDHS